MRNGARIRNNVHDYFAIASDFSFDYKVSDDLVTTFQTGILKVKNEPGTNTGSEFGYYGQLGLLFYSVFQPVVKYEYWEGYNFAAGGNIKTAYISGGANYFINGHTANIKFEYQNPIFYEHHISGEKKAVLQFQIFI